MRELVNVVAERKMRDKLRRRAHRRALGYQPQGLVRASDTERPVVVRRSVELESRLRKDPCVDLAVPFRYPAFKGPQGSEKRNQAKPRRHPNPSIVFNPNDQCSQCNIE